LFSTFSNQQLQLLSAAMGVMKASYRPTRRNPPLIRWWLSPWLILTLISPLTLANEDLVNGRWLSGDGDGWIDVSIGANGISGRVAGSPNDDPNRSRFDSKNPDPALRDRGLLGIELFSGFVFDGDDKWKGGTIYDPNSGKTYRCIITVVDENTLKVRGYIGVALLGRTETWSRVQQID
jgi:uncharacterized protein (DUF2147 family)